MDIREYYKRRAAGYDHLYHRGERQPALGEAAEILCELFEDKEVLEIACGTGYWTEHIANTARKIFATDINESMLQIAKGRSYLKGNVEFSLADFYHLTYEQKFESLFGGFIWSHIPLQELDDFIDLMNSYVKPGGTLVFIDNNFVEGSSTPITQEDESGNSYQLRTLDDGGSFSIIKNFPEEKFLREKLKRKSGEPEFYKLKYYWILSYRTH